MVNVTDCDREPIHIPGTIQPYGVLLALAEPELLEKLKQLGTLPFPANELTPEAHARLFAADLPRVATLIESSGIKASEAK